MALITGTHHVALRVVPEKYPTAFDFYANTLQMPVLRTWNDGKCAMLSTGNSIVELLTTEGALPENGMFQHLALATEKVDEIIDMVRGMGLTVTIEPKDVVLGANPGLSARIAFFISPTGETIELFNEKGLV